jgi:hypothetical protein
LEESVSVLLVNEASTRTQCAAELGYGRVQNQRQVEAIADGAKYLAQSCQIIVVLFFLNHELSPRCCLLF